MVEKVSSHFSVRIYFNIFFAHRLVGSGPGTRWKLGSGMSWSNLLGHGSLFVIHICGDLCCIDLSTSAVVCDYESKSDCD